MQSEELVILVNDDDEPIGFEEKLKAHQEGKQHRAFSIFVFRKNPQNPHIIELLLQQRQWNKYHCGGYWTNTCCSHPRPNEELIFAAKRRLHEEMGIYCDLKIVGRFHYIANLGNGLIENEIDHVIIGYYQDASIPFNTEEVADYRWIGLPDLEQEYKTHPHTFTPWFLEAYLLAKEHL